MTNTEKMIKGYASKISYNGTDAMLSSAVSISKMFEKITLDEMTNCREAAQEAYQIECFLEDLPQTFKSVCNDMISHFKGKVNEDFLYFCRQSEHWNEDTYSKLLDSLQGITGREGSWTWYNADVILCYVTDEEWQLFKNWKEYWRMIGTTDFVKIVCK